MTDQSTSMPSIPQIPARLSSREVFRHIYESPSPQEAARALPAQTLYLAIREHGLSSSSLIIESASLEQCRFMFDLDVWEKDIFSEEQFWEWLELPDDSDGLEILQKFIRFADLKLIALVVQRWVQVHVQDEPTDEPPLAGAYTPDKGATWLRIECEDERKAFLLGRLLALIFETDSELFYQLISIPLVATPSMLEEQSLEEREKRLSAEGIPDRVWAAELHHRIEESELRQNLGKGAPAPAVQDIRAVSPFCSQNDFPEPLQSLLVRIAFFDEMAEELTLLLNAAIVHFGVSPAKKEELGFLLEQVRGALNIGLQTSKQLFPEREEDELFHVLGFRKLYRLGFWTIKDAAKKALPQVHNFCEALGATEPAALFAKECLSNTFPCLPGFLFEALRASPLPKQLDTEYLAQEQRAFCYVQQCESLVKLER